MIIVDFNQTAISTLMAELAGRTDVEIRKDLIRHMIINAIRSYKVKFGAEFGEMVIACDNRHYWRKDKFPYYKASRKKARQDSGFDWKLIFDTLSEIRAELAAFFPYQVIDVEGAEADDVIAVLAQWTQDNAFIQEGLDEVPQPVLILSGDHDFIQLQKFKNVSQFSPIHKKWVKPDSTINSYLMEHIVKGDKGDGIPNILSEDDTFVADKRQKPVTSKKLEAWQQISIDDFHNHVEADVARNFQRNRYLIDFEYIPDAVRNNIVAAWTTQPKKDRSQLLNYFMEHKMKNMIDHLGEF
jgi:5'-3' exonuclease